MTATTAVPPKVLISYSHDSPAHRDRVLQLADRLRRDGIDCTIDQYVPSPSEGWPRWMMNQLEQSAFVLMVCTDIYHRRVRGQGEPDKGKGADWEGAIITQEIYDAKGTNTKFIPVILGPDDAAQIPIFVRGVTFYRVDLEEGYEQLYRRLTGQHDTPAEPLGEIKSLPPKRREDPKNP
jgi:hypothetical protein